MRFHWFALELRQDSLNPTGITWGFIGLYRYYMIISNVLRTSIRAPGVALQDFNFAIFKEVRENKNVLNELLPTPQNIVIP